MNLNLNPMSNNFKFNPIKISENWWVNKTEWDFFTNWYKNRETQLKEWQSASDEEKKELLKVYYKEIMEDE